MPVDPQLTPAGTALFELLERISASDSFIFGHHNTDLEGQNFNDHFHINGRGPGVPLHSDVLESTGKLPGMTGFNLDWVARDVKLNIIAWREAIQPLLEKGIVIQFFWEAWNPTTMNNAHDLTGNPIVNILPGGSVNGLWVTWMDRIVAFFQETGLETEHAAIFRPFHEASGNWFWWGTTAATTEQFHAAWRYTTGYIRERVHSLLYAYSPSKPTIHWDIAYGMDKAITRYPGDDEVDIACFDRYGPGDFARDLTSDCTRVSLTCFEHIFHDCH